MAGKKEFLVAHTCENVRLCGIPVADSASKCRTGTYLYARVALHLPAEHERGE